MGNGGKKDSEGRGQRRLDHHKDFIRMAPKVEQRDFILAWPMGVRGVAFLDVSY
uniref:Uncharacterized protein n=1 Tax=Oryza brachyantha TaxID=4533 RepID=J3LW33_ORYBR